MAVRNQNLPPLPQLNMRPIPGAPPRPAARALPALPKGWRGTWTNRPDLDADRWKVGRVGKGPRKGKYVAKPVRRPRTPPAQGVGTGTGDPLRGHPDEALLRQYADEPWAQNIIRQLRAEQVHHQGYVTNQVMPWQSGALTGLAQINQAAQDNFTGQANAVAQGMAQAGTSQPGPVMGTQGGAVSGPNAFLANASAQGMATQASTQGQMAAWQGLMGTLQPTTYSQGQIAALSDYAKGLPVLYATKRAERVDAIDKYLAEREQAKAKLALEVAQFEETQRANRVREAISATNAQTGAAVAFGNLGIRAADSAADNAPEPAVDPNSVPYGFVLLPNGDIVRDPTVPQASDSGSGGGGGGGSSDGPVNGRPGERTPGWFAERPAWTGNWKKRPSNAAIKKLRQQGRIKGSLVQDTAGNWWVQSTTPSSSGGSSGSNRPDDGERRNAGTLQEELRRLYDKDDQIDAIGWEERYNENPRGAATAVAQWVANNRVSFGGRGRPVNLSMIEQMLLDEIGRGRNNIPAMVIDNLRRTHWRLVNGRYVWK